jgi:hypothetical protein
MYTKISFWPPRCVFDSSDRRFRHGPLSGPLRPPKRHQPLLTANLPPLAPYGAPSGSWGSSASGFGPASADRHRSCPWHSSQPLPNTPILMIFAKKKSLHVSCNSNTDPYCLLAHSAQKITPNPISGGAAEPVFERCF